MLARTNRLSLLGVRRTRRIGQDNEFERLRDYTLDDNYKHIDWRSTARRGKLTVKDFQANQSQRVMFLIDCGRMMTNTAAGLEPARPCAQRDADAQLTWRCGKGDSVGLLCFSDEIHRYVPPRGGMNQMNRLLHASFDRFPRLVESRYDEAFVYLASHCRKRSLVVLITNVIDEVNANQVEQYLTNLVGPASAAGRAAARSAVVRRGRRGRPTTTALYRAAAAAEILTWRQQVLADLTRKGVLSLDVFPEQAHRPAGEPLPGDQGPAFAVSPAPERPGPIVAGLRAANARRLRPPAAFGDRIGCRDCLPRRRVWTYRRSIRISISQSCTTTFSTTTI